MENSTVSILCYTMDGNVLDKIGLLEDGTYFSTIESEVRTDDSSLLHRAKEVFSERFNTDIDNTQWKYLGEMQRKKDGKIIYCYAVDTTDAKLNNIKFYSLNKVSKISDAICQACFFRLFSSLYKKDILQ